MVGSGGTTDLGAGEREVAYTCRSGKGAREWRHAGETRSAGLNTGIKTHGIGELISADSLRGARRNEPTASDQFSQVAISCPPAYAEVLADVAG